MTKPTNPIYRQLAHAHRPVVVPDWMIHFIIGLPIGAALAALIVAAVGG